MFWIRRFLTVFAIAFVIIAGVQWLKGHAPGDAIVQGAIWSLLSTTLFTATRWYRARRGEQCALCRDTPGMLIESPPPPSPQGRVSP